MSKQHWSYFSDIWNLVFWSNNILSFVIVLFHGLQYDISLNTLIQVSSVAIVLQWVQLYYWMRLFP